MNNELRKQLEAASRIADDFGRVYYDYLDNRRQYMSTLYKDTAYLQWEGDRMQGRNDIERHFRELPVSRHYLKTMDSQPMMEDTLSKCVVLFGGKVEYVGQETRTFYQSFILGSENGNWKILSDSYGLRKLVD